MHVLLCFTEQGKILKVLHTNEDVFIISQYSLFHNEGPIINMAIDSQKVRVHFSLLMNISTQKTSHFKLYQILNTGWSAGWEC